MTAPIRTAVLALAMAGTALPALASNQGSIRLRGVVPAVCTISVSNQTTDLNIVQGVAGMQIATVTEQCNASSGYTVSMQSANGGRMVEDQGGAVSYSLSYDNASAGSAGALQAERGPTGAARQRALFATLPASPQARAGTYTDTVTVSITAK